MSKIIDHVQVQYNECGDNPYTFDRIPTWLVGATEQKYIRAEFRGEDYWYLIVKTVYGWKDATPGDLIAVREDGELDVIMQELQ